jgi:hypothetical protein
VVDMHISLALEAQESISINNVLPVEKVRIGQSLFSMIKINEVWWYLRYHGDVLKKLHDSAIHFDLHFDVLGFTSFEGVDSDVYRNNSL